MTNARFHGAHPDMTYLGRFGVRRPGVTGDYHSKLVLYAYSLGMSELDCKALFTGEIYRSIGYFEAWNKSSEDLRKRDSLCDLTLADQIIDLCAVENSFFTFNHPTVNIFRLITKAICQHIGVQFYDFGLQFHNPLFGNYIWPIYPEIREEHRLPYSTPFVFAFPMSGNADVFYSRTVDLEGFINASYAFYNAHYNASELARWVQEMEFFEVFSKPIG